MRKPKMVLFDYGHTLAWEDSFDGVRGNEAVMPFVTENKRGVTGAEISALAEKLYSMGSAARGSLVEVHNQAMERMTYELLGVETSLSPQEREYIFWTTASPGHAMPYIDEALDWLWEQGIRTAVISNISFGGYALAKRINTLIPRNHFEFFIASSDYMIRKPHPMIFEAALVKAGVRAEDAWFCGDTPEADIAGAAAVGMFPVWFQSGVDCYYRDIKMDKAPDCEHLTITDWRDLRGLIEAADSL